MDMLEPKVFPYRVLSLDGGGIRGAYQAVMLHRLAAELPALLAETRLFAGTSIGGINALLLASGLGTGELLEFYKAHGRKVFDTSWQQEVKDLGKLIGAGYRQDYLAKVLDGYFGSRTLDSLPRRVIIPTFQLDSGTSAAPRNWKMKFFHNFPGSDSDGTEKIVDVALRTSAGPTYFPTYQGYIDGGVGCNNPSMAAVAAAIHPSVGRQDLAALGVLSVSTGANPQWIEGETHDWGYAQWARPLVDIMIDANVDIANYQCQQILSSAAYYRLNPVLSRRIGATEAAALDDLMAWAEQVDLAAIIAWLKSSVFAL